MKDDLMTREKRRSDSERDTKGLYLRLGLGVVDFLWGCGQTFRHKDPYSSLHSRTKVGLKKAKKKKKRKKESS